jgi:hypothetical protein
LYVSYKIYINHTKEKFYIPKKPWFVPIRMEQFIKKIKQRAKKNPKKIIFPESLEERVLKAA